MEEDCGKHDIPFPCSSRHTETNILRGHRGSPEDGQECRRDENQRCYQAVTSSGVSEVREDCDQSPDHDASSESELNERSVLLEAQGLMTLNVRIGARLSVRKINLHRFTGAPLGFHQESSDHTSLEREEI